MAMVIARLADTGGERGLVAVGIRHHGTDIAFIKQVVIVVADFAAEAVLGIPAQAEFEFVFFQLAHAHFNRHAVAL